MEKSLVGLEASAGELVYTSNPDFVCTMLPPEWGSNEKLPDAFRVLCLRDVPDGTPVSITAIYFIGQLENANAVFKNREAKFDDLRFVGRCRKYKGEYNRTHLRIYVGTNPSQVATYDEAIVIAENRPNTKICGPKSVSSASSSRSSSSNVDILNSRVFVEPPALSSSRDAECESIKKEQQCNPIEINLVKESPVATTCSIQASGVSSTTNITPGNTWYASPLSDYFEYLVPSTVASKTILSPSDERLVSPVTSAPTPLIPNIFNTGAASTSRPLPHSMLMNFLLSYGNVPSTSNPSSNDYGTFRNREDPLYSDMSYDYSVSQSSSDVSKSCMSTSSSSMLSSSFQNFQSSMYTADVQGRFSPYASYSGLAPTSSSNRTPPLHRSANAPSFISPTYNEAFSASSLPSEYTSGPLTITTNDLTSPLFPNELPSDVSKSCMTTSSSSMLSSSFQSFQPPVYTADVQGSFSTLFPPSPAVRSRELMDASSYANNSDLASSSPSNRTPPLQLSANAPSFISPNDSASSSASALPSEYTSGSLTRTTSVWTSRLYSNELPSLALDILNALETQPITTSMQTLSGPSMSIHQRQSDGSADN